MKYTIILRKNGKTVSVLEVETDENILNYNFEELEALLVSEYELTGEELKFLEEMCELHDRGFECDYFETPLGDVVMRLMNYEVFVFREG